MTAITTSSSTRVKAGGRARWGKMFPRRRRSFDDGVLAVDQHGRIGDGAPVRVVQGRRAFQPVVGQRAGPGNHRLRRNVQHRLAGGRNFLHEQLVAELAIRTGAGFLIQYPDGVEAISRCGTKAEAWVAQLEDTPLAVGHGVETRTPAGGRIPSAGVGERESRQPHAHRLPAFAAGGSGLVENVLLRGRVVVIRPHQRGERQHDRRGQAVIRDDERDGEIRRRVDVMGFVHVALAAIEGGRAGCDGDEVSLVEGPAGGGIVVQPVDFGGPCLVAVAAPIEAYN